MKRTRKTIRRHRRARKPAAKPLAPFRRQLEALRLRLIADRRSHQASAAQPIEPHSESEADSATDEFDRDLNLTGLSAGQNLLYEVEAALRRIDDGSYGRCEATGRPIPRARLRAVPWTRFTKEAEERLEQAGEAGRIHLGELRSVRGAPEPAAGEDEGETSGTELISSSPSPAEALIAREAGAPARDRKRKGRG